jgi:hypothetical protein
VTPIGDEITYKIQYQKPWDIYPLVIQSILDHVMCRSPLGGDIVSNYPGDDIFNWSKTDSFEFPTKDFSELDDPSVQRRMVTIDTADLIGFSFLKNLEEDGQRFRAQVICAFIENLDNCKKDPRYKKFICKMYKFQGITVHQNSRYNVSMKRKTGEKEYESFVACTQYA